ncbi:MAG: ATP-binding cassette domain-containing protein, partial [Pseudomonadota bacterium]
MGSADIALTGLTKRFGQTTVIEDLSVRLESGAFTVILGPSGCGKSTLLNMIAGLEQVTSGTIEIGGRAVQDLPPNERGLAMVFQNYALYPHMSVADNIGYALKIAGVPRAARATRITEAARVVSLSDYLDRRPAQLSGGQRQRVAIARAIIREPAVLLFDEPLSNLDAKLRHGMRMELAELHRRIGATSVFVTHDQVEAMTLADKIILLNGGRIEQYGTPHEIYHHPASEFVAEFIGA